MSSECLGFGQRGPATSHNASLYPSIFFSDVAPFMLHPLHSEVNRINFINPEFHVAVLSPCLSWFLSFPHGLTLCPASPKGGLWFVSMYWAAKWLSCHRFLLLFLLPSPSPFSFLASSWGLRALVSLWSFHWDHFDHLDHFGRFWPSFSRQFGIFAILFPFNVICFNLSL